MEQQQSNQGSSLSQYLVLFRQTVSFFKSNYIRVIGFFCLFLLLSIPDQLDLLDWNSLNPLQLWLFVSILLLLLAATYLITVSFVLWISERSKSNHQPPIQRVFHSALVLLVPLSILSIRGTFLFGIGLFALIVPGFYFSFKYSLASFCLMLEGWRNDATPIARAEKIISKFRLNLLGFALIGFFEWLGLSSLEFFLRWREVHLNIGLKIVFTLSQAVFTTFYYMYMTFAVKSFVHKVDAGE
jgi:uncharacterized membrane protein YesL